MGQEGGGGRGREGEREPYLRTKSAFFPLTEAPLHKSHCFSSGILRLLGSLPFSDAPGISSASATAGESASEAQGEVVDMHLFPYTNILINVHDPLTVLSLFQIFVMKLCYCIKPHTKVSVFKLLKGTAGGCAHMPWLDTCIGVPAIGHVD